MYLKDGTFAFHLSESPSLPTELAVTIDVDYTPPSDFVGGPNDYRATSTLTLTCQVTGGSGTVTYLWTSTCAGCFINSGTFQNQAVGRGSLQSVDSDTYTCMASRGSDTGNATIEINVVGECIHACIS